MNRPTRGWYRLERPTNEAGTASRAVVRIYDAIGGWFGADPQMFADELDQLDVAEIELRVNSPGGDVFDGLAIMNTLQAHPARVIAHVDGLAASAASFIVVGGADEVVMGLGSELMLHNPRAVTIGPSNLHRDTADRLDKIADSLISVYQRKAGGDLGEWRDVLAAETWYSADEAVDAGLADRVDAAADPEPVSNRLGIQFSAYSGRLQAPAPAMPGRETPTASAVGPPTQGALMPFLDDVRQRLGIDAAADEATTLAALEEVLDEQTTATETTPTDPATGSAPPDREVARLQADIADRDALIENLRRDAQLGRDAHDRQQREDRERNVDAAITDGRVAPARRDAWLARLAADPAELETLNALEPGLAVPVGAPKGHTATQGQNDPAQTDDYWFPGVSAPSSREG